MHLENVCVDELLGNRQLYGWRHSASKVKTPSVKTYSYAPFARQKLLVGEFHTDGFSPTLTGIARQCRL